MPQASFAQVNKWKKAAGLLQIRLDKLTNLDGVQATDAELGRWARLGRLVEALWAEVDTLELWQWPDEEHTQDVLVRLYLAKGAARTCHVAPTLTAALERALQLTHRCYHCKEEKPLAAFVQRPDGRADICKQCHAAKKRTRLAEAG